MVPRQIFQLVFVTCLVAYGSAALAGVNLKNGNFYISYNDCINPNGGEALEIVRTYNSKAYEVGWFGYGWGSDFETYLVVHPDGVVIHENGSGALTRFTTAELDLDLTQLVVDQLVAVARRRGVAESPSEVRDFAERMKNKADLRLAYYRRYRKGGWIKPTDLPLGTVLHSAIRGHQTVLRTPEGYVRTFQSGKKERFSLAGKLVRVTQKNGDFFDISYDSAGHLAEISDFFGNHIQFTCNSDGLVTKLTDAKGNTAEYEYRGEDLVRSRDVTGNIFSYDYDRNHNLTGISYSDGTTFEVVYDKVQFVKEITYRNGDVLDYSYGQDPENPSHHYWTTVKTTGFNGGERSNRYEYWIGTRADGSSFTRRIRTDINGFVTDTLYDDRSNLPIEITRGNKKTTFEYNSQGLLTRKETPNEIIEITYDSEHSKISEVVNRDTDNTLVKSTSFKYSKTGELLHAEDNSGLSVDLVYDSEGRIQKMHSGDQTLLFAYNDVGKPTRIEMVGVGEIDVQYDDFGEITKVESEQGSKMALRVTQAFQQLLDLVKPAGVNLNF